MTTSILHSSFLAEFVAVDVQRMDPHAGVGVAAADRAIAETLESGLPSVKQSVGEEADAVAMAFPVYRADAVISLAVFIGKVTDDSVGVMEVWQPIGGYDELNLTQGYFGPLERFQNVSSFVRFERGSGLPGQVWRDLRFIIHDNLPSHPGFLRAAGASAESLQLAVGMPVFGDDFLASVLLVSADATPIARGYEVWRCPAGDDPADRFQLESCAYQRLEKTLVYEGEATAPLGSSLPGLALQSGLVCTSDDPDIVYSGRPYRQGNISKGIAIPFYEGDRITNVLTLLL